MNSKLLIPSSSTLRFGADFGAYVLGGFPVAGRWQHDAPWLQATLCLRNLRCSPPKKAHHLEVPSRLPTKKTKKNTFVYVCWKELLASRDFVRHNLPTSKIHVNWGKSSIRFWNGSSGSSCNGWLEVGGFLGVGPFSIFFFECSLEA